MNAYYAGDITSLEAWDLLQNPDTYLIDTRTHAEYQFTGTPWLQPINKELITIPWREYPAMNKNPDFSKEIARLIPEKNATLLFLCRSGGRSREAAIEMTKCGYAKSYNVADGFEGDLDSEMHRGNIMGWKASNLPWRQS